MTRKAKLPCMRCGGTGTYKTVKAPSHGNVGVLVDAQCTCRRPKLPRAKSPGEEIFAAVWASLGGPEPIREYKFHPDREWRFDFAWPKVITDAGRCISVAVEIEGGTRGRSRHTSHAGFVGDCEKYNAAARLGWRVFRLTTDMVDLPHLREILEVMG